MKSKPSQFNSMPAAVAAMLSRLKRRIRAYVAIDGAARTIAWVALAYWVGLALDYLPVSMGSTELPRGVRQALLAGTVAVAAYLVYRFVLRRVFARLTNQNMAMLLERRFAELDDTLLTTVAPASNVEESADPELHRAMLAATVRRAGELTAKVDSARVLDYRPLARHVAAALLGAISIGLFAAYANGAFVLWSQRWLTLSDQLWPRRAYLEIVDFPQGRRKVAEGSDLTVQVRAAANRPAPAPDLCTIYYRTEAGDRGRVNMSRDGEPVNGFQYYRYEGQPFQGMLDTITFDVVGLDYRVADLRVDVVPSPSIVKLDVTAKLPAYLASADRHEPWRPGLSLPMGSSVTLQGTASKTLREVRVDRKNGTPTQTIKLPAQPPTSTFTLEIADLNATAALEIELLDTDDVLSDQPYRVAINALEDVIPQVNIRLKGIGTAVTPQVTIPITGEVKDDYGIETAWFQLDVPDKQISRQVPLSDWNRSPLEQTLDLRRLRAEAPQDWPIAPGDKLVFSVRARDAYNLAAQPHLGQSDELPLDVVTPDELLALLEARELNLKRRFEQTLAELIETRDSLLKLSAELAPSDPSTPAAPSRPNPDTSGAPSLPTSVGPLLQSGTPTPTENPAQPGPSAGAEDSAQQLTLHQLRVQRAQQQAAKSHLEVDGVSASFAEIRDELINNRVDTPERKDRLQQKIVDPLELIVNDSFPGWLNELTQLERQLADPVAARPLAQRSVQQADQLILALQAVLDNMLELESFNELIDLVRSIITDQEKLQADTEAERKRQARELLEQDE